MAQTNDDPNPTGGTSGNKPGNSTPPNENGHETFNPKIPGLKALLLQTAPGGDEGFVYYTKSGLNIVIYGPAGVGKTILALQMAVTAAGSGKRVVYLTKDTPGDVLYQRVSRDFQFFDPTQFKDWVQDEKEPSWLRTHQRNPKAAEANDPKQQEGPLSFAFLNELWSNVEQKLKELKENDSQRQGLIPGEIQHIPEERCLAFSHFDEIPSSLGRTDRFAMSHSVYDGLGYLQPKLKPLFRALKNKWEDPGNLFIVCDSLSPATIEEHLRMQQADYESRSAGDSKNSKPIFLFVMESETMPTAMSVSFPPDIQIGLGFRSEPHDIQTRTIRLVKTRFQKSLDEQAPFIILGKDSETGCCEWVYDSEKCKWAPISKRQHGSGIFGLYPAFSRGPGIHILPPLSHEAANLSPRSSPSPKSVIFGINGLDTIARQEGDDSQSGDGSSAEGLAGGGCTLLVTNNRCGATPIGLHYLLAQIGEAASLPPEQRPAVPNSVLYISFSDEVEEILHTIWHYPKLRRAVLTEEEQKKRDPSGFWNQMKTALRELRNPRGEEMKERSATVPIAEVKDSSRNLNRDSRQRHRLYRLKLAHHPTCPAAGSCSEIHPFLNIFLPDFSWITAEDAMQCVVNLLKCDCLGKGPPPSCLKCFQIDRIVVDRVGRLQARWPLVENCGVFISSLVALCNHYGIELMVVDDTAQEVEKSSLFHSHWQSLAQNVIRLRRIPFHGVETTTIELITASTRIITGSRPQEVVFHDPSFQHGEIRVENSFRGYTGLAIGEPTLGKVKVELSYDEENTPLYYEMQALQQNLENAMDAVEVVILGRGQWSGINSAFCALSKVSRNTCHIAAIDGVWLQNLFKEGVLHELTDAELKFVLPKNTRNAVMDSPREVLTTKLDELYVTECTTNAVENLWEEEKKGKKILGDHLAVPMRHNWGVLAVTRLSIRSIHRILYQPNSADLKTSNDSETSKDSNEEVTKPEIRKRLLEQITTAVKTAIKDKVHGATVAEKDIDRMLGIAFGDKERIPSGKDEKRTGKLFDAIWEESTTKQPLDRLTWDDIAEFRVEHWEPFWGSGWAEKFTPHPPSDTGTEKNLWLRLFPRIDLFSLATASEESAVSFFLELLLANVEWEMLFGESGGKSEGSPKPPALLKFKPDPACKQGFLDTLVLFFRLLSHSQRRQFGIGLRPERADIGTGLRDQIADPVGEDNAFRAWPRQISLLSRQWITTVEDLMPRYDVRESIVMIPLPKGTKDTYWERLGLDKDLPCYQYGPTVAGTWYLGILKGGNADLGMDVMRVILSEEQELQRLLNRCGGPVSRQFYGKDYVGDLKSVVATRRLSGHGLPYVDVMQEMYPEKNGHKEPRRQDKRKLYFPFHRTQIHNYLEVSAILYDLVRHVMRWEVKNEADLLRKNKKIIKPESFEGLREHIEDMVERTFGRLRGVSAIYQDPATGNDSTGPKTEKS